MCACTCTAYRCVVHSVIVNNKNIDVSWSKLEDKSPKPLGWWKCKYLCEFGWWIRNNINYSKGDKWYYHYLNKMVSDYKINLYGVKIS